MADDSEIKVRVRADGASVKKAIAGITREITAAEKDRAKEAAKADKAVAKASEQAAKERTKSQERHVSSFKRAEQAKRADAIARAREILENFRKAERKKREEMQKTLREVQMSERQRAAIIRRAEREIASSRQVAVRQAQQARSGGGGGRGMAIAGGLAAGGAALAGAGISAVNRMAAAGGVRTREQLLQETLTFNRDLAALSAQSGIEAGELRDKINEAAIATGRDQAELLESLQLNQGRFGNVDAAVANLEALSRAAVGANASVGALSLAVGTAGAVYGLSSQEADEYLNMMLAVGEAGSIEAENLAETFAPYMGVFQRATGQTGLAGAQNATRFAGLMGTSFANDSEAKTLAEAALRQLGSMDVQERLALATGGRATGRGRNRRIEGGMRLSADGAIGGQVQDPLEAIRQLQALNLSPGQMQRILGDSNAVAGVGVIGTALQSEQGQAIMNASAADGRGSVAAGLAAQESVNAAGRDLDRARAESFADFQRNGDAYTRAVVRSTEEMGRLNATYPGAIEGLETLKEASIGLVGVFAAVKLAALGGAGGAAAGAGAGLGAGGLAAAGGVAALGAAVAIPAAVAGVGMTVDSPEGGDMFDFWGDVFSGVPMDQAGQRPSESASARAARDPADDANTRATQENTRATQEAARAMQDAARAIERSRAGADTGADTGLD